MELSTASADFHVRDIDAQTGSGLFASREFKQGEEIYPFDYWSEEVMPMHMTNHSCDANGYFNDHGMLEATRDIHPGDEITFNYLIHRIPASPWNFKCTCGAENCIGWVDAEQVGAL